MEESFTQFTDETSVKKGETFLFEMQFNFNSLYADLFFSSPS